MTQMRQYLRSANRQARRSIQVLVSSCRCLLETVGSFGRSSEHRGYWRRATRRAWGASNPSIFYTPGSHAIFRNRIRQCASHYSRLHSLRRRSNPRLYPLLLDFPWSHHRSRIGRRRRVNAHATGRIGGHDLRRRGSARGIGNAGLSRPE
jgi:hypothetical protein